MPATDPTTAPTKGTVTAPTTQDLAQGPAQDLTDQVIVDGRVVTSRQANLAILALSIGGFAIGTTEFVTMGLLPQIADGTQVSIPVAGHYVSAYAAGVVVGAPLIAVLFARTPRKGLLLSLMAAFALFNFVSGFAHSYGPLMATRFLAGMPHGAFFGIGMLVAASLVAPARRTWAVAMILAGLGTANVIGVPLSTLIGQRVSWSVPYWAVGVLGAITVAAVAAWVPHQPPTGTESMRAELTALRRVQVWFALLIGTIGFGGMFATYSYIAPTMTQLGGFAESTMPWLLCLYGIGMVAGMALAGKVSHWGIMRGIIVSLALIVVLLLLFAPALRWQATALIALFLLGVLPSILVPLLQTRLMDVAHEGQSLAATLNHATLNTANALGAYLGSVVLAAGYGYGAPSLVGAGLAALGVLLALGSAITQRRATAQLSSAHT